MSNPYTLSTLSVGLCICEDRYVLPSKRGRRGQNAKYYARISSISDTGIGIEKIRVYEDGSVVCTTDDSVYSTVGLITDLYNRKDVVFIPESEFINLWTVHNV